MIIQTHHKIIGVQTVDHMLPIAPDGLPPEWDTLSVNDQMDFIKAHQEFEKPYAITVQHNELVKTEQVKDYTF